MLYIRCYKTVYLLAVAANFIVRFHDPTLRYTNPGWAGAYVWSAAAFLTHAVLWVGLEKRTPWAVPIEKLLWGARFVLILGVTVFLYVLIPVLPLGDVLWTPLVQFMPRAPYWIGLAALLGIETVYFYQLRKISLRAAPAPPQNPAYKAGHKPRAR